MKRIVAERVLEQRLRLGISQKEVARRIEQAGGGEINYQSIQQLESGDVKKPSYAIYLADALDTTWEFLTNQTDNWSRPTSPTFKNSFTESHSDGDTRQLSGRGKEGPYMLTEISRMLGQMEGRMEARFDARFDQIQGTLNDHSKRLDALEGKPSPQRGRRR